MKGETPAYPEAFEDWYQRTEAERKRQLYLTWCHNTKQLPVRKRK